MTEQFPGNSNKSKEPKNATPERPTLARVTRTDAKLRERTMGDKAKGFFTGPRVKGALLTIASVVILPALKDLAEDAITTAIRGAFNGGDYEQARRRSSSSQQVINYNGMSKKDSGRRELSHRARATHDFSELVLQNRAEGDKILNDLQDVIDQYGSTTVKDMYDLAGVSGSFTDGQWGWYDLRGCRVVPTRGGYALVMTKPEPIE